MKIFAIFITLAVMTVGVGIVHAQGVEADRLVCFDRDLHGEEGVAASARGASLPHVSRAYSILRGTGSSCKDPAQAVCTLAQADFTFFQEMYRKKEGTPEGFHATWVKRWCDGGSVRPLVATQAPSSPALEGRIAALEDGMVKIHAILKAMAANMGGGWMQ